MDDPTEATELSEADFWQAQCSELEDQLTLAADAYRLQREKTNSLELQVATQRLYTLTALAAAITAAIVATLDLL